MSGDAETWLDPKAGGGIRSTPLARWGAGLLTVLVGGVGGLLGAGLFWGIVLGVYLGGLHLMGASAAGMWHGLGCVLALGTLGSGMVGGVVGLDFLLQVGVNQGLHDAIVRWQFGDSGAVAGAGLPAGALSRARPSPEPQPTPASLSPAGKP